VVIVICLVLTAVIAAEWTWSVQPPAVQPVEVDGAVADMGPLELVGDTQLAPLESYAEVVERPLFLPGRRPPPPPEEKPVEQPKTQVPPPKHLRLSAVIIGAEGPMALIRDSRAGDTLRQRKGSEIEGWRVADILPNKLLLRRGTRSAEIILRDFTVPPPTTKKKTSAKKSPAKREARQNNMPTGYEKVLERINARKARKIQRYKERQARIQAERQ
jgi:hypothetical protein